MPIVAVLALLLPWVLLYLVSGKEGMKGGWPLAVVGSLAYIAGQYLVARYLDPYLLDVTGSIACFIALLILLKVWKPKTVPSVTAASRSITVAATAGYMARPLKPAEVAQAWLPFAVLLVVVAAWTGPWSQTPQGELVQGASIRLLGARGELPRPREM